MYDMNLPEMYHVRQSFNAESIENVESDVIEKISSAGLEIKKGDSIAITVGSRGVAFLESLVRSTVKALTDLGARPFIVPAMGSHGGATAEGQEEVLAAYGVTRERVGAPVLSSMEVVEIPSPELENRVFMDKYAWESDGVMLLNRIKPHTDFRGRWESGLVKIAVIGLGKHALAEEIHSYGVRGLKELIAPTARRIVDTGKIIGGLGVVENAYEKPALPVSDIDLLVIDIMGKDKSGTGIDTNIVGRLAIKGEPDFDVPNIGAIIATDLSDPSHGNGLGVGLTDVITRKLFDKLDLDATRENVVTSTFLDRGRIPVVADTDEEAIGIALRTLGLKDSARICRIRSTLELSDLLVSSSLLAEIPESAEVISGPLPLLTDAGIFSSIPEIERAG
jgi:hypothetical protein